MKKVISMFLTIVLCCTVFVVPVSAANDPADASEIKAASANRIDLPDGGYIIEEVTEYPTISRATSTKSGQKTSTRYTASGAVVYSVQVIGTFSYNGTTSSATSSSATVNLYAKGASFVSKSAWYSGNTAYASGTVKYLGYSESSTVSISCDKNGNLY